MNEEIIQKLAVRESRLIHILMENPKWKNMDLYDALIDIVTDIITIAKSDNIYLYDLFHDAVGEYASEANDESVYNEL